MRYKDSSYNAIPVYNGGIPKESLDLLKIACNKLKADHKLPISGYKSSCKANSNGNYTFPEEPKEDEDEVLL